MENEPKYTYFQYMSILDYPIYLRVPLGKFDVELPNFLKTQNFFEVKADQLTEAESKINTNLNARVLTMEVASSQVARQINEVSESDRYGLESIVPKPGYRVYRYKKIGVILYSFNATEWKLGCIKSFGTNECATESRIIINRFLSWSLSTLGVVGIWGVPVEEGLAVMKRNDSLGEAVFFDIKQGLVITMDGKKEMQGEYKILRLDPIAKREVKMRTEELIGFLNSNCTYIDFEGMTIPVRQSLQALAKLALGVIHPREDFSPRTDLSL